MQFGLSLKYIIPLSMEAGSIKQRLLLECILAKALVNARISDIETLRKKTKAWNRIANRKNVTINWKLTKKDAQEKLNLN